MKREEFWLGVCVYAIVIALGYAGPALRQIKWPQWIFSSVLPAVKTVSAAPPPALIQSRTALFLRPLRRAEPPAPALQPSPRDSEREIREGKWAALHHLPLEAKDSSGRRTASVKTIGKPKRGFGTEVDLKTKPGNREADSKQS